MTTFTKLQELYRAMSDDEWKEAWLTHADGGEPSVNLPPMPDPAIQRLTNNMSGRASMAAAFNMYSIVRQEMAAYIAGDVSPSFLDLGGGWGRIARYMTRDIPMQNLAACDVDDRLVSAGTACMPDVNWQQIVAGEPLPYDDNSFSVVLANSVLSHLDEELHMHTVREVARVLRPQGIFLGTALSESHLQTYIDGPNADWLAGIVGDLATAKASLRNGEFVYGFSGRWVHYGMTFLPPGWVEANWAPHLSLEKVRTDYAQDVYVGRKSN